MPYYKFDQDDIFYNRIETHPQVNFIIYDQRVYYKNKGFVKGANVINAGMVPVGYVSLYELNVDRATSDVIYPFIVKDSSLTSFKTISTTRFNNDFVYGDTITGSYPMSASISSDRYAQGVARKNITALRTALKSNQVLSTHYAYSSSLGDKSDQELRLISIPSIFYDSTIEKGTVSLKFLITGTLAAELKDDLKNGELRQVSASYINGQVAESGSVGGVVLYDEGFVILTGSWNLGDATHDKYIPGASAARPRWIDFGSTGSSGAFENMPSSSFEMNFSGTNFVPTLTMFATAPEGELNSSNNPTAIQLEKKAFTQAPFSGSTQYVEPATNRVKNIGSSSFSGTMPRYEKTVFINQIGIYDKNRNLIGVAKLATPVRKRDSDDYTFKLKLDF
jgi:hypothetical protein